LATANQDETSPIRQVRGVEINQYLPIHQNEME
jgi:hypothetical protein